jgi:NAD(P)-dependent dehydrogenase (short-subunit alcohol dehydrogenase family)
MDLGLEGKVALVTGASRGIGAAIATTLAREGCDLALAARTHEGLEATAAGVRKSGRRAFVHVADLREKGAPARFAAATQKEFGGIDIVVCNAGATKRGDFLALTEEDLLDGFALKFFAHAALMRAAWPALKARRGAACFIVGIGGRTPGAEFTVGGPVNAALLSLTKALAEKGIADGVRVNAVSPGSIVTDRFKGRLEAAMKKLGVGEAEARKAMLKEHGIARFGEVEDIAGMVAFVVGRPGDFLQGSLIDMDGGQTRTI